MRANRYRAKKLQTDPMSFNISPTQGRTSCEGCMFYEQEEAQLRCSKPAYGRKVTVGTAVTNEHLCGSTRKGYMAI